MKLTLIWPLVVSSVACTSISMEPAEPTIANDYGPLEKGDPLTIECIERQIDTGEHKFDDAGNVVFGAFPICKETRESLTLPYGRDEAVNCTITLHDEVYHLFQLYLHEDVPFSCRLITPNEDVKLPLTIGLHGQTEESHLDISGDLQVLVVGPDFESSTAVAYGTRNTTTSRYIIGDELTLQIHTNWYNARTTPPYASFYSHSQMAFICTVVATLSAMLTVWASFKYLVPKHRDFVKLD